MNGDKYERPAEEDDIKRKKKLHLDVHEERAGAGFQDLKNAGRFWRATQIMGTRKKAALQIPINWVYWDREKSAWSLKNHLSKLIMIYVFFKV